MSRNNAAFDPALWESSALSEAELLGSDWQTVFDILRRLSEDPRLDADKIRCVVWYSI